MAQLGMRWRRWWMGRLPPATDALGIAFAILILAGALLAYLWWPFMGRPLWYLNSGPGWTCEYPARGEPVCIKNAPGTPSKPAP